MIAITGHGSSKLKQRSVFLIGIPLLVATLMVGCDRNDQQTNSDRHITNSDGQMLNSERPIASSEGQMPNSERSMTNSDGQMPNSNRHIPDNEGQIPGSDGQITNSDTQVHEESGECWSTNGGLGNRLEKSTTKAECAEQKGKSWCPGGRDCENLP